MQSVDTGGSDNTAVGNDAGRSITTGDNHVCIGSNAGDAITTGSNNVCVGKDAMGSNTTGGDSVCIGSQAGAQINDHYNVFIGYYAGKDKDSGQSNVAVGHYAFSSDQNGTTDGHSNTCVGKSSGMKISTGDNNACFGFDSGKAITTGGGNVCVGPDAGETITTGSSNIIIGNNANPSSSGAAIQIVLGANVSGTGDYQVTIGNDSVGKIHNSYNSNATWSRTSDKRWKKDINTNTDCGLNFINDLRTVTYKWKAPSERPPELIGYDPELTEPSHKEKMYGFIAQEIKESLDKYGITDFNGWNENETDGSQNVSYEMFVVPLVKAVQELTARVEELESRQ